MIPRILWLIYLQELKTQPIQCVLGDTNLIIFYFLLWLTIQKNLKKKIQITQTNCRKTELKNRDEVEARRGGRMLTGKAIGWIQKPTLTSSSSFDGRKKKLNWCVRGGSLSHQPCDPSPWIYLSHAPSSSFSRHLLLWFFLHDTSIFLFPMVILLIFLSQVIQLMFVIRPCSYANLHEETASTFHYPFYFGVAIGFVNPTWDRWRFLFFFFFELTSFSFLTSERQNPFQTSMSSWYDCTLPLFFFKLDRDEHILLLT